MQALTQERTRAEALAHDASSARTVSDLQTSANLERRIISERARAVAETARAAADVARREMEAERDASKEAFVAAEEAREEAARRMVHSEHQQKLLEAQLAGLCVCVCVCVCICVCVCVRA